jgi:DNA-binding LacI/PurR family transcriptional regulator
VRSSSLLSIALLCDRLDDEYQVAVIRGALSAARDLGVSLLCVAGGRVRDLAPERAARNVAFELVNAETVSGVAAVTSVIGSAIGRAELGNWLERFAGLPLCCVGVDVAGKVTLEVDNAGGIRELVLHLAQKHQRRRIAFIRGPVTSEEANTRFDAYRAALAEAGLDFDSKLIVQGDFLKSSGTNAVSTLLDERRIARGAIDAIVAANDYMALGALRELARRQIDVPDEIAVVGFDDVESARFVRPALTTTSQPTELLGRRAVEGAFALAQGRPFGSGRLPTKLVLRASCGCSNAGLGLAASVALPQSGGVESSFMQRRQTILAELARAAAGRLGAAGSGWEARLLDALLVELRSPRSSTFYRALEQVLQKLERVVVDGIVVQDVLSALRRQSLPCVAGAADAREKLEDALHEARVLVSVWSEEASGQRVRAARELERTFQTALRSVLFSGPAELSRVVAERLPDFGIEACVVVGLDEPGNAAAGARLLFGFGPGERITLVEPTQLPSVPKHPLLQNGGRAVVALPLEAGGRAIGVALLCLASTPEHELEGLREFLGTALDLLRRAGA